MTGMVAVIAHDRTQSVSLSEAEALATIYEQRCGSGARHAVAAGNYAHLIKIDNSFASRPGIEATAAGWAALTGVAYGNGSLLAANPADLDGQFGLVIYDRPTEAIRVCSDPFGLHPLYVAESAGKTYISSSALTLAQHLGAQPNRLALALLLCCGSQYGSITNWEGIERLDPATCLRFTAAGQERATYWRLAVDEEVARLSYEQTVDTVIEVLTETFRRYLAEQPCRWVDLTGGYDTRLLTLLLDRAGVRFRTNTVGAPHSDDVRLAQQIVRATGWDWHRFRAPTKWAELASAYVSQALSWADGRLQVLHLAPVLWIHGRQGLTHRTHLAGGGGEALSGYAWNQEFFRAGRSTQVNYDNLIRMQMIKGGNPSLLAHSLTDEVYGYLQAQTLLHARSYSATLNTTQLDVLLARRRIAWDGAFAAAAGAHLQSELPFFFKPIFSTVLSINYRYRNQRRLARSIIERLNPKVAAIPTTQGGPAQPWRPTNVHRFAPFYAKLGRLAVIKINQKLWQHPLFSLAGPPDTRAISGSDAIVRELALTPATMRSAALYKSAALEDLLYQVSAPDFKDGEMLGRVITVELAMRAVEG